MKVVCLGGGPAGLYFAISMKLRDPAHEITVLERNKPGDTFGWGVVFSDQTMDNLRRNDPAGAVAGSLCSNSTTMRVSSATDSACIKSNTRRRRRQQACSTRSSSPSTPRTAR